MVPHTVEPRSQVLRRALQRATAERIVVYRVSPTILGVAAIVDGQWTRKPYTVAVVGERASEVVCDCPASAKGLVCKHAAAAMFARKYHVFASRPRPAVDPLASAFE